MTHDHRVTTIRREDLDRQIDGLRTERLIAASEAPHPGLVGRVRRRTGALLITAGTAIGGGHEARTRSLGTHRGT